MAISGSVKWQLVNKDNTVAQESEHSNMITNAGLDGWAAISGYPSAFRQYAAVGTGVAAPQMTDSALLAEVARTSSTGGIVAAPATQTPLLYSEDLVREFTADVIANKNLTEYGFSGNTAGIYIRGLFKDGNGNPVVITPDGTQKLRIYHTLTLTNPTLVSPPTSLTITGIGIIPVTVTYIGTPTTFQDSLLKGHSTYYVGGISIQALQVTDADTFAVAGSLTSASVVRPYVTGSFSTIIDTLLPTSMFNGYPIAKFILGGYSNYNGPSAQPAILKIAINNASDYITKDNLHSLSINGITFSWSGA